MLLYIIYDYYSVSIIQYFITECVIIIQQCKYICTLQHNNA